MKQPSFGRARGGGSARKAVNEESGCLFISPFGLTEKQAEENRKKYGENVLTKKKRPGFFRQLLSNFNDPIIKILIGALIINAAASLGNMNIPETLGIAAAILIATFVSTASEYGSSLAFERLCSTADTSDYRVLRDGEYKSLKTDEIAAGDIVMLSPGQTVPADGILISGAVSCNQSALTGESAERHKTPERNLSIAPESFSWDTQSPHQLFRGSGVCTGSGELAVLRTGDRTFIGNVASELQEDSRPSPLKHRLGELAKGISFLGYAGALMIAFAYLFNSFVIDSGMNLSLVALRLSDRNFVIREVLRAVTVAVSVIVVAVPEGLPMMITVILSSNMKKMLRRGVLVRRLVGIETAGNMNILFTDKTGTLTTGKMTVCEVSAIDCSAESVSILKKRPSLYGAVQSCVEHACGTGKVSSTEKAVMRFFGMGGNRIKAQRTPFDSAKKFSCGLSENGSSYYMGAPERLLAACKHVMHADGSITGLEDSEARRLYGRLNELASSGLRVICCAAGDGKAYEEAKKSLPGGLVFLCFITLRDPLRRDVKEAVSEASQAGIQVIMVTGDSPLTAGMIAREAGIIRRGRERILTASQLAEMSDSALIAVLPETAVIARALPGDKIRLVKAAQAAGLVAGMTGDGINDAPALKAADVGFAMGSGTDIAREAGDIVITDDSFPSITRAVLYGRTIFESIRKFIVFQLTMNLCAMGVSLIGPFMGIDSPVTVIQMLWVNIIMDTLGGLAFAGEPALKSYMRRGSLPRDEKILSPYMISQILFTGGYSLLLCVLFLQSSHMRALFDGRSETYYLTVFFALLIFCGIFNSFNARTNRLNLFANLSGNKPFILIMSAVAVIQLMIIYFGGDVFRCVPLDGKALLAAGLLAATVIPADLLRKIIFGKRRKKALQ